MNKEILEKLAKQLRQKQKDVRFCNAFALTMIARDAMADSKKKMREKFVLRNSWSERGFKLKRAEKTDENPVAEIIVDRWYVSDRDQQVRTRQAAWIPSRRGFATLGIDEKKLIPRKYSVSNFEKMRFPYDGEKGVSSNRPFKIQLAGGESIAYRPNKKDFVVLYQKRSIRTKAVQFFEAPITEKFTQDFQKYYDEAWAKYVIKS